VTNHWTFVQTIDLQPVINEFNSLRNYTKILTLKLTSKSDFYDEYINALTPLCNIERRITMLLNQIFPYAFQQRQKRGLFNPLGSFIKSITGNLDQTDAELIDKNIQTLQANQNKLKIDALNRISLLDKAIDRFKEIISNITFNEQVLRSRISYIEEIVSNNQQLTLDLYEYLRIFNFISQLTSIYQSIYDVLDKIEIALTFAKTNTLHNSIINPDELLKKIGSLTNHLHKNDKIPITINSKNLLILEKLIEVKSFVKDFKITFIFEFPLVDKDIFQYYHLFALPIPNNQSFLVNLPYKQYLSLSDTKYFYHDEKCLEVQADQFLCQETHVKTIEDHPPCAIQLLTLRSTTTTCHPFAIHLHDIHVTKVIDGKWAVTIPASEIAKIKCGSSESSMLLSGSYLIEVPQECTVRINSMVFESYETSELVYQEVSLPTLNWTRINQERPVFNPPSIDLKLVNLKATDEIQQELKSQAKNLQEMSSPVYLSRTSLWTIFIYIFILIAILYFIFRKCYVKVRKQKQPCEVPHNQTIF